MGWYRFVDDNSLVGFCHLCHSQLSGRQAKVLHYATEQPPIGSLQSALCVVSLFHLSFGYLLSPRRAWVESTATVELGKLTALNNRIKSWGKKVNGHH